MLGQAAATAAAAAVAAAATAARCGAASSSSSLPVLLSAAAWRSPSLAAAAVRWQHHHHNHQQQQVRGLASTAHALVFDRHGEPSEVLRLAELEQPAALGPGDVRLRLLAAPVNPSDVNTVQGRYPLAPPLPGAVPGHEGVARVEEVGPPLPLGEEQQQQQQQQQQPEPLRPGDLVVPLAPALGTWRSGGVFRAADWHRVPPDLPVEAAATLAINPPTALCMLEQFVALAPGDVVVQNGATSAVGQHVVQLARAMGVRTVNVIRERQDWDEVAARLAAMGADLVTTEARLKADLAASGLPAPRLALNCVGGSCGAAVAKALAPGGVHVTYGAMAMQPLQLPASLLIFKDVTFRGFWVSGGWSKRAGPAAKRALLDRVAAHYRDGHLRPPALRPFLLAQWRDALGFAQSGFRAEKAVFVMPPPHGGGK